MINMIFVNIEINLHNSIPPKAFRIAQMLKYVKLVHQNKKELYRNHNAFM